MNWLVVEVSVSSLAMKSSRLSLCVAVTFGAVVAFASAQSNFAIHHTNPAGGTLRAFATSGGIMVAAGDAGLILSSADGVNWTQRTSYTTEALHAGACGAAHFILVGDHGTILRSGNGSEWVPAANASHDHLYAVTYGKGYFFAVGDYGTTLTSANGEVWTEVPRYVLSPLRAVDYVNGEFFAGGDAGVLWDSTDGVHWSSHNSAPIRPAGIAAITSRSGGVFVIGEPENIYTSWNSRGEGVDFVATRLRGVGAGAGLVIAAGDNGVMAQYVGGFPNLWNALPQITASNLHAVGFSHDTFVAVGDHETILQSAPVFSHALRNISVRAEVGAGERALIGGFAIRGLAPKRLLIRGAGPALANFAVESPLAHPVLTIFNGAGAALFTNAGWSMSSDADTLRSAAPQAGAFAFPEGSADAALVVMLAPGIYTAVITVRAGETGEALIECYDLDPIAELQSRLTNLSARAFVSGDGAVLPGLSISNENRLVLLRAIGPGLTQFGVSGALKATTFRIIYPGLVTSLHGGLSISPPTPGRWYLNWNAYLDYANALTPEDTREAAARTGAFPLVEQSKDAAALMALGTSALNPYSVEVRSADGSSGIVLVEIYDVTDP